MNLHMTRGVFNPFDPASPKEEARAIEEAEAAVAEGRILPHEAMRKWLRSWGKRDELQPPKCGE